MNDGAARFDATLYRQLHVGTPGDVDFYLRECAEADGVLELGCGDGRVLAPLAAAGHRVAGVELHPEMLGAARARLGDAAVLVQQDMAALDLPDHRFDRVIAPFSALFCLKDDTQVVRCLKAVRRHLSPRGRFVFDTYSTEDIAAAPAFDDETPDALGALALPDGRDAQVFEWDRHRPTARTVEVTYEHRFEDGTAPTRYTLRHHYLTPDALPALFEAAGLRLDGLWGDFERGPLHFDSAVMVGRATVKRPDGVE